MLDPRLFRTDLDFVKEQLNRRSFNFNPESYSELEARRKDVQVKTQELQNERNSRSKAIGQAKAKGEDVQPFWIRFSIWAMNLKRRKRNWPAFRQKWKR